MKYDVVPDERIPERLFWVREVPEKGRAKRLAGYPLESLANKDRAERESDQRKRERAAQRRVGL